MDRRIRLQIARLVWAIRAPVGLRILPYDASYRPFVREADPAGACDEIPVDLRIGPLPGVDDLPRVFSSGQAWSLHRGADRLSFVFAPDPNAPPLWIARTDRDLSHVTIHCSDALLVPDGDRGSLSNPVVYPLDQLLCIYLLARRGGAIFHAAGGRHRERAYLFAGRSGAGKSTLTRLLAGNTAVDLLSDDRIVVRNTPEGFRAFGTPWPGDARIASNRSAPLEGIFFLRKSPRNWVRPIPVQDALERILPVTSIVWFDRLVFPDILQFCHELVGRVPAFEMGFRPTREIVDVFAQFAANSTAG